MNKKIILFLMTLFPCIVFGHHGKEFLVVSTYTTPDPGKLYFLLSTNRVTMGASRELEFEPGILYGIQNRWSVEIHMHHGIKDHIFRTESVGLETRYRILGPEEEVETIHLLHESLFSMAALFELEKNVQDAPDRLEGRLILGENRGKFSVIANGIGNYQMEKGNSVQLRYGLGVKYNLTPVLSAGIELDGNSLQPRITPGIYGSLVGHLEFRLGVAFETTHRNDNFSVLTILIYPL